LRLRDRAYENNPCNTHLSTLLPTSQKLVSNFKCNFSEENTRKVKFPYIFICTTETTGNRHKGITIYIYKRNLKSFKLIFKSISESNWIIDKALGRT
jgi:hypothetical protein